MWDSILLFRTACDLKHSNNCWSSCFVFLDCCWLWVTETIIRKAAVKKENDCTLKLPRFHGWLPVSARNPIHQCSFSGNSILACWVLHFQVLNQASRILAYLSFRRDDLHPFLFHYYVMKEWLQLCHHHMLSVSHQFVNVSLDAGLVTFNTEFILKA